ncbi:MAG: helicase-associated domain-containing protein, partial [Nocardioidaceae bacterium]
AEAARDLGALADVESRGGATVYRFSVASLRRAHSLGWSVDDITRTLLARSRTPLPQPLTYLVEDLARLPTPGPRRRAQHGERTRGMPLTTRCTPDSDVGVTPHLARSIVATLRASTVASGGVADLRMPTTSDAVLESPVDALREAVESGELIWFAYLDANGAARERLVHAQAVDGGLLQAKDSRVDETVSVPVRRIIAAHIIRT